jgi:hypothetical protein
MMYIVIFIGCALGNYIYQFLSKKQDFSRATEITYFQGIAILMIYLFT